MIFKLHKTLKNRTILTDYTQLSCHKQQSRHIILLAKFDFDSSLISKHELFPWPYINITF